jgi:hypothetical protein
MEDWSYSSMPYVPTVVSKQKVSIADLDAEEKRHISLL